MKYDPRLGEIEILGSSARKIDEAFNRVMLQLETQNATDDLGAQAASLKARPAWAEYRKRFAHLLWASRKTALIVQPHEELQLLYPQVSDVSSEKDYQKALLSIRQYATHTSPGIDENRRTDSISHAVTAISTQFALFKQLKPPTDSQTVDVDEICNRLEQFHSIWSQISDDTAKIQSGLKAIISTTVDQEYTPQAAIKLKGTVRLTKELADSLKSQMQAYVAQMDKCGIATNLSATLAHDAAGIYDALAAIATTFADLDAGLPHGEWKLNWDALSANYFDVLTATTTVTASGVQYLTGRSLQSMLNMIDFQDPRRKELRALVETTFEQFIALKCKVELFRTQFFQIVETEAEACTTKLCDLRRKMVGLEAKTGSQSKAMSIQQALKQIPGMPPVVPFVVAEALKGKQGTLSQEVNDLEAKLALLWRIQNALTMVVLDLTDVAPRYQRFASTWVEVTNESIKSLDTEFRGATTSATNRSFLTRVNTVDEEARSLSIAMADYSWGIEASGILKRRSGAVKSKL
ncbi:hypothetical protein DXG03_000912 [Asterophora parasitica]|uniref:Uncharacterized protein n=1 Tax=Asterophora parasitica TaxID=117018 RepID=A0A9P7KBU8_9AGAR|nr:hypothetical protein DXG03_000912 [Asterophora parasitica]